MIRIRFKQKNKNASLNSYKLNEAFEIKTNFTLFLTPRCYFPHKYLRYLVFLQTVFLS